MMSRNSHGDSAGSEDGSRFKSVDESAKPGRTRDGYGRFLPGAPAGPGRPKLGDCLSDALRKYGEMPLSELATLANKKDLPMWDVIAIAQLLAAADMTTGDRARKDLADRLEGRAHESVRISHESEAQAVALQTIAEGLSHRLPRPRPDQRGGGSSVSVRWYGGMCMYVGQSGTRPPEAGSHHLT